MYHCDEMVEAYNDVIGKIYKPFFVPEDQRAAMYPNIFDVVLPAYLKAIDSNCTKG